jgi:hypothetical protein
MDIIGNIESFFRFIYSWIATTDEVLGRIVYVVHILVATTIAVLVVVSHTIYPVFWFQFMIFCIVLAVWLQHIFLQNCFATMIENKLLQTSDEGIDIILKIFGIPLMKETRMGFTLITGTIIVGLLGLELVARSSMFLRTNVGASAWV